jgi:hypothetical protein
VKNETPQAVIDAEQERIINTFKNAREKLLQTNAAIWFNKICRINHVTPQNSQIKIKCCNQKCRNAELAAKRYQEIKYP